MQYFIIIFLSARKLKKKKRFDYIQYLGGRKRSINLTFNIIRKMILKINNDAKRY